ncbi:MAG: TetR/AcrR family transcriptional regulator [Butyrivibrio sp.]|uniref:TetR/AcrR family transcriptional regulator n=1 Tax=Butyrivibrio sp. TaxID=28121 RepID=UPI001B0C9021|nr:TetR/AcrR family transcriptional regulator [Butyrivibrio sp.]MBO6241148.1 TetR/AcrR family transcriptional regulator [Butyrivibrio sp.]
MPRDKTASHIKVIKAAKKEFMDNGFEKASIREIGARAGITSAGLYRHCKDKEDLFCQVVNPAIEALDDWIDNHISNSYRNVESGDFEGLTSQSEIDMIREVAVSHRDEFKLLMLKSSGTRYENFMAQMVDAHENKMWEGLEYLKQHGFNVKYVNKDELHILISAYMTALFEPIIKDYPVEKINHYLSTVENFFMPGWHKIYGL